MVDIFTLELGRSILLSKDTNRLQRLFFYCGLVFPLALFYALGS